MKKLLFVTLTLMLVIALTVSAAAQTPVKDVQNEAITVKGKVTELRASDLVITTDSGKKFLVPTALIKDKEDYKKMNLKQGDQLEVVGTKAVAAALTENGSNLPNTSALWTQAQAGTIRIHISKDSKPGTKTFQGTIKIDDKNIKFEKVEGGYVLETEDGNKAVLESGTLQGGKSITYTSAEAQLINPEKITAKGITIAVGK